jgi:hypothetical protein
VLGKGMAGGLGSGKSLQRPILSVRLNRTSP